MEFFTKTKTQIPPIIIINGTDFIICGNDYDTHLWLNKDIIRQSTKFFISDPYGNLLEQYGEIFKGNGYDIKVLNTADYKNSAKYNPFAYIEETKDITKFVAAIINGTKGDGKAGDINFIRTETMLYEAIISYMKDEGTPEEQNIQMLIYALQHMKPYKENRETAVDLLFEDKEKEEPENFSVCQYKRFKKIAGKKGKYIIDSCINRLTPLDTEEMRAFLSNDELDLKSLFWPSTALFVVGSNNGTILDFLAPLMYSQLFDILYNTVSHEFI
jgi:type IV secretion system protein VirD4